MSRKYIKEQIIQNFVYPNNERDQYDIEIVHDINNNCVSGDINTFSATTTNQTGITIQYSFDWDTNGAELFQMDSGNYSYISVHMMAPTQTYFKPFRVAFNIESSTLYTGTTTFTGSTTVLPENLGEDLFSNGTYYYEVRFIGHRCIYPVCGSFTVSGITPSPTPTPTPTPTATPTVTCYNCYEYSYTASTSGLLEWLDCDGIMSDTFVDSGNTYTITCPGAREGTVSGSGTIVQGTLCGTTCVTPTPTSTPTSTSTPTTTTTPTSTATPTPTSTPTVTPTTGSCECYWFLNETGGPLNYSWDDCVAGPSSNSLAGGASAYECVVVGTTPTADGGITITQCGVNCTTTCLPCA